MNGTNKAVIGTVYGIALIASALVLAMTVRLYIDEGTLALAVPSATELGQYVKLHEFLDSHGIGGADRLLEPITRMEGDKTLLFAVEDDMLRRSAISAVMVLGFVLSVAGMFSKWSIDCKGGEENPAQYLWTHRPKALKKGILSPWGLIPTMYAKHPALVIVPIVLLPFYAFWSIVITIALVVPVLLAKGVVSLKIRSAAKKDAAAFEKETMYSVCPFCKRNFERPKVRCGCGLELLYPVPNEYGYKYHACNDG
ncbi:MAG: hypothetical protein IJ856_07050, partial [Candidatus Methanomethylophilaceae archaeon]|nr:hypothetical protein [Candidatus Methanomethylophilaceae archaeon]